MKRFSHSEYCFDYAHFLSLSSLHNTHRHLFSRGPLRSFVSNCGREGGEVGGMRAISRGGRSSLGGGTEEDGEVKTTDGK